MHEAEIQQIDQLSSQANRSRTIDVAVPALLEARQVVLEVIPSLYEKHPNNPEKEALVVEVGEAWRTIGRYLRAVSKSTEVKTTWEKAAYEHAIVSSRFVQPSTVATATLEKLLFERGQQKKQSPGSISNVRSAWERVWHTSQDNPDRLMMTSTWYAATALREGNYEYGREGISHLIEATALYNQSLQDEVLRRSWPTYFVGHTLVQSLYSSLRITQYKESISKDAPPAHEFAITFPYKPDPYDRFKG